MKENKIFLVDLDHTLYNVFENCLYDDAIELINFLKSKGKTILFTEGDADTQKGKIKRFKLENVFRDDILVYDSYSKMSRSPNFLVGNKVYLIDDNPNVINEAKSKNWTTIRVKRGRYINEKTDADYEVSDLKSIESIII